MAVAYFESASGLIRPVRGRHVSKLLDRIRDAIFANPIAWFFFLLAVMAEYGNYQRGHELTQVCEILPLPDVTSFSPKTAKEKAERICLDRLSDDGSDND
jgi:hypothetical protein